MISPQKHVSKKGITTWKVRYRLRPGRYTSETFRTRREADQFCKWLDALGPQGALDQLYPCT